MVVLCIGSTYTFSSLSTLLRITSNYNHSCYYRQCHVCCFILRRIFTDAIFTQGSSFLLVGRPGSKMRTVQTNRLTITSMPEITTLFPCGGPARSPPPSHTPAGGPVGFQPTAFKFSTQGRYCTDLTEDFSGFCWELLLLLLVLLV